MGEIRLFPGLLAPKALDPALALPSREGRHLIAFGEGARKALWAAFREGAESVTLISPLLWLDPYLKARLGVLRWAWEQGGLEGFSRAARALLFGRRVEEGAFQAWRESLEEAQVEAWLREVEAIGDERRLLRGVSAPVLLLVGRLDPFLPLDQAQGLSAWTRAGGVLFALEDAGHLLPLEAWGEVRLYLEDFLL